MIALNLGIISAIDDWDGRNDISLGDILVSHRSLPHGHRNSHGRWISDKFTTNYDYVIISTRDPNCSLLSSIKDHQPNSILAKEEQDIAKDILKNIMSIHSNVYIFSYESAYILQDSYTKPFLKNIGIANPTHVDFKNINSKYVKE